MKNKAFVLILTTSQSQICFAQEIKEIDQLKHRLSAGKIFN
jgi:hypothetical protein